MVGLHSLSPSPGTRVAVSDSRHFVPTQATPRQNHLLAALSQQEYQRVVSDLEPCPLPLGWTIHEAGGDDRPQLEARVCECYAVIKREYNDLLADYRQAEGPSRAHLVTRAHAFPQQSVLV